jgi:hypothetical protein
MGNLNGIPINWGVEDEQLLRSLFPEGLQDMQTNLAINNQVLEEYKSPLQSSIFYTPKYTMTTLVSAGKTQKEIVKEIGSKWAQGKRTYFYEQQFQKSVGMKVDFDKIADMLNHITTVYKNY